MNNDIKFQSLHTCGILWIIVLFWPRNENISWNYLKNSLISLKKQLKCAIRSAVVVIDFRNNTPSQKQNGRRSRRIFTDFGDVTGATKCRRLIIHILKYLNKKLDWVRMKQDQYTVEKRTDSKRIFGNLKKMQLLIWVWTFYCLFHVKTHLWRKFYNILFIQQFSTAA